MGLAGLDAALAGLGAGWGVKVGLGLAGLAAALAAGLAGLGAALAVGLAGLGAALAVGLDRKSTRLNSSHR